MDDPFLFQDMDMKLAPIVIFAYNRPWHTRRTVEALKKNELADQSELIIYTDGPKSGQEEETVQEVRQYINNITGFKNIRVITRTENLGLANSIISGVTEVIDDYGRVIVLEDDMVTSPYFLPYMNDALEIYRHEKKVICIHAYSYPTRDHLPHTFFLRGADCWGWATWKRGWELFKADGESLLNHLKEKKLTKRFDMDGTFQYTRMLEQQITGENDSWAILWHASAFLANRLTLYPGESLISNIGIDSSGTHCLTGDDHNGVIARHRITVGGIEVEENLDAFNAFKKFMKYKRRKQLFRRIKKILKVFPRARK